MKIPQFKITITHGGTPTDYEKTTFESIQVKRPENDVSSAILLASDLDSKLYPNNIDKFDTITIGVKDYGDASYTTIFSGTIRQVAPTLANKYVLKINAKGLGAATEDTHCNTDYGKESSNITKDTAKEIWQDLVDNYINKSLGTADTTGYSITKTKIADIASGTSLTYLNNPYRTCKDVINRVCHIVTAIQNGAAGPHWFVDTSANLIINTIGTHENPTEWPDWWNTDEAGSTLEQGVDFTQYVAYKKTEEFANKILFLTDFRRPPYDYWTENQNALWGTNQMTLTADSSAGNFVVGSYSLKMQPDANQFGDAYYPTAQNLGWDVTDWGSEKTVPHIAFYFMKDGLFPEATAMLEMCTTSYHTDYFYSLWSTWTEPDDKWIHRSIPIGPYWATADETRQFRWVAVGSPDWTNINCVDFHFETGDNQCTLRIDDLHIGKGKIIREAKNSTSITANNEYQKLAISRTAMDDSGVATDDSGMAARYAYAELLRRQKLPLTIQFTVPMKKNMLPGQKIHVHAAKTASGSFNIDSDFRVLVSTHIVGQGTQGFLTTVTATDDLVNSFPMTAINQRAILTEYLLVNNREATDIRAGGEVDLLIPVLSKDYPS